MPVTAAVVTNGSDGTTGTSAVTASVSPEANKLQLLHVHAHPAGGPSFPTSITGCSLTWNLLQEHNYSAGGGDVQSLYYAIGSSPSTGSITIDFGTGNDQLEITWSLVEFGGVDTGSPIVQSAKAAGTSTTAAVTLATFASSENATYGAAAAGSGGFPLGVGSGFTSLHNFQGPTVGLLTLSEWRADNDTSVDASVGASVDWGMIGVEIRAAPSGPPPKIVTPVTAATL